MGGGRISNERRLSRSDVPTLLSAALFLSSFLFASFWPRTGRGSHLHFFQAKSKHKDMAAFYTKSSILLSLKSAVRFQLGYPVFCLKKQARYLWQIVAQTQFSVRRFYPRPFPAIVDDPLILSEISLFFFVPALRSHRRCCFFQFLFC